MPRYSRSWVPTVAACAALLRNLCLAQAADYTVADLKDADTLERSLFLCQWRFGHRAPEGEPAPVVCTTAPISTDDAVHETKQWWTYWARFNTEAALKAKMRFNEDFLLFQARLARMPDLAEDLLPQDGRLPEDDWRVALVRDLVARATAHP
jgi:hypothetical protein